MTDTKHHANNLFIEFHVLRSYAPGNMNRDELGTPKSAMFGGVRRLRLSSQCVKRTWRTSEYFQGVLGREQLGLDVLGVRTKRLPSLVREELSSSFDAEALEGLDEVLLRIGRSKAPSKEDEGTTAHLLFLTQEEISAVREFAKKHKANLAKLAKLTAEEKAAKEAKEKAAKEDGEEGKKAPAKGGRGRGKASGDDKSKSAHDTLLEELQGTFTAHMNEAEPRNAVDVALFGRFVTSKEFATVDAAMQVAHALGTQKVELEYDYFVAVDDRKPKSEDVGAAHLGETEFAQSVLYQYAVCDWKALLANLHGHADNATKIAAQSMRAIALAAARSVPMGKKNGTAPQNPADYLEIVVRKDAPISLANAFLRPIVARESDERDVMELSIASLRRHADGYHSAYSKEGDVLLRAVLSLRDLPKQERSKEERFTSLDALAVKLASMLEAAG